MKESAIYQEKDDSASFVPGERGFRRRANDILNQNRPHIPKTDGELGTFRRSNQSPKLDPPDSTESDRMASERNRDNLNGQIYNSDPTIDLDSPEEDLAFRIVIQEARKQQDKKKHKETKYQQHRYDGGHTPPAKNQPFYSLHRTPEPPTPVRTPVLTVNKVEERYSSSSKNQRSRVNYETRWAETPPPKHHSSAEKYRYHRSPQNVETNLILTRVHEHDQSPKISFTNKKATDRSIATSSLDPSFPARTNPSMSTSLETPDLATETLQPDRQSGSSLQRKLKTKSPLAENIYPATLSKTFESIEHDVSLRSLMDKVQRQQEELIKSLDFAMESNTPEVPKEDFAELNGKFKTFFKVNNPGKSLSDLHDTEQKRQFVFDSDDERIGKLASEDEEASVQNEESHKSVFQENLVDGASAVSKEITSVKNCFHVPTGSSSYNTPIMPPPTENAQTPRSPSSNLRSSETDEGIERLRHLYQTDSTSSIKSLLELMNTMQDTIDRQDALISLLQADNNNFRDVLMKTNEIDPSSLRTKASSTASLVDRCSHPPNSVIEESSNEDVSTKINRQWHRLESVRRKHGWI